MSKIDKQIAISTKALKPLKSSAARTNSFDIAALFQSNPLAALLGGIALGAAAGALLPRSDREQELLAPLGERLADAARAALAAGREAGNGALADAGITSDGLRDQVSGLLGQVTSAAGVAGRAAFSAATETVRH